jgi:hypothetical protein
MGISSDIIAAVSALVSLASLGFAVWQYRSNNRKVEAQAEDTRRSAHLAERSAKAAEDSAWIAKEGMRVSQRAWVTVAEARVDGWQQPRVPVPTIFKLAIRNGGHTPALNCKVTCYYRIREEFAPIYDGNGEVKQALGVLGPEGERQLRLELSEKADMIEAFSHGKARLFAFGQIEYEDIFGDRSTSQWAFVYRPNFGMVHADIHGGILDYVSRPESEGN